MTDFKFGLGDLVKDKITGFEGVVTCQSRWLNACNTYGVQARSLHDGKIQDRQYFDEPQLVLVETNVMEALRKTGGPERPVPQLNR